MTPDTTSLAASKKRLTRPLLRCIIVVSLMVIVTGTPAPHVVADEFDARRAVKWRSEHLEAIATKIQLAKTAEASVELSARKAWLQRWQPGQMPLAPDNAPMQSELTEEPMLGELQKPEAIDGENWQQMEVLQRRLIALDTLEQRKEKLSSIIQLAREVDEVLSANLAPAQQSLKTPLQWALAFARYRLGRALAYRELPVVRQRWPISDPERYEEQLTAAYRRLVDYAGPGRPEFILLEDRMLRRAGKRGQALELLEGNRNLIEPKWYLKKRRDLLKELEWDPPYREAALRYHEAGYRDEP